MPDQPCGTLAHLTDRTGRGGQRFRPQRLDGIGDQQLRRRRGLGQPRQDLLHPGLGQCMQAIKRQAQALGSTGDLGQRFLTGHVQRRQTLRQAGQRLQQQGRFADAGITPDQHHRALHQPPAKHPIQLTDAGRYPRLDADTDILQRGDLGAIGTPSPAAMAHRSAGASRLDHELGQRVPGATLATLALPFREAGPALTTDMSGLRFSGLGGWRTGRLAHG